MKVIFNILLFLCLIHSNAASSTALDAKEKAWLEAQESIYIGARSEWPPFNFLDFKGNPSGIGAEIIEELNKKLGGKLKIVSSNWSDIYSKAKEGEIAAIMDITPKEEREPYFFFTQAYLQVPHVIVSQKNSPVFSSLKELEGKSVALERDTGTIEYLKKSFPNIAIKTYDTTSSALNALSIGEVDAYVGNRAVVNHLIAQEFLDNLKIDVLDSTRKGSPLSIGVSKKVPELYPILQKALDEISNERMNEIFGKWGRERIVDIGLSEEEKSYLRSKKKLTFVSANEDWAPFSFKDESGVYKGVELDFLELLENRVKIPIEVVHDNWAKVVLDTENGVYDAVFPASPTPKRKLKLLFSDSYYLSPIALVVKRESPSFDALSDFGGKSIGIVEGSALESIIKEKLPEVEIRYSKEGVKGLLKMVLQGEVDGILDYQPPIHFAMMQENLHSKLKAPYVFYSENMSGSHYGINLNEPLLLSIINKAINSYTQEEKRIIKERWECQLNRPKEVEKDVKRLSLSKEESEWIKENPLIRVSSESNWPPFDFTQDGIPMGLGVDFTNLIAAKAGLKVEYAQGSWEDMVRLFKEGKIDVVHSVYKTPDRERYALFTSPYYTSYNAMAVRKNSDIRTLNDLRGRRVAIIKEYGSSEVLLRTFPDIIPVPVENLYEGLKAVSFGDADAVIESVGSMSYIVMEQTLTNLRMSAVSLGEEEDIGKLHFMTSKNNEILRNILQKGVESLSKEEIDDIRSRWILSIQTA